MGNQGRNTAETTGGNHVCILGKIPEENPWKISRRNPQSSSGINPWKNAPGEGISERIRGRVSESIPEKKSGEIPLIISKRIS